MIKWLVLLFRFCGCGFVCVSFCLGLLYAFGVSCFPI